MPPGACLSLRWGREDGRTALSGPYDRPGAVAAVPDPHESPESPESGTNGPVPSQTSLQSPENPAVEAVRTPSPYLYPSGKPALGCPRNTPDKTPALDGDPLQPLNFNPENPNPQRPYGPPLLQGDRHAPESVIGLSELVIGIVGIRSRIKQMKVVAGELLWQKPAGFLRRNQELRTSHGSECNRSRPATGSRHKDLLGPLFDASGGAVGRDCAGRHCHVTESSAGATDHG